MLDPILLAAAPGLHMTASVVKWGYKQKLCFEGWNDFDLIVSDISINHTTIHCVADSLFRLFGCKTNHNDPS